MDLKVEDTYLADVENENYEEKLGLEPGDQIDFSRVRENLRKLVPHYECFLRCAPKLVEPTDRDSFVKFAQDTYEGLMDNDIRTYIGISELESDKWEVAFDQEPEIEEVVMDAIERGEIDGSCGSWQNDASDIMERSSCFKKGFYEQFVELMAEKVQMLPLQEVMDGAITRNLEQEKTQEKSVARAR